MTEFENYRPDAWQLDGMTLSGPVHVMPRHRPTKRGASWKVAITTTVFSIGDIILDVPNTFG